MSQNYTSKKPPLSERDLLEALTADRDEWASKARSASDWQDTTEQERDAALAQLALAEHVIAAAWKVAPSDAKLFANAASDDEMALRTALDDYRAAREKDPPDAK
jgi:hypothetical protein